jgi:hypothetical protein
VEDRLYKIRHCLNIDGVFSPPVLLFPPPDQPDGSGARQRYGWGFFDKDERVCDFTPSPTWAAVVTKRATKRVNLGTTALVLPKRHPLPLA